MVRRADTDPIDRDERLGEAIEAFLALTEEGRAPDPEQFAADYPELGDELKEALEGLALVQGLVGDPRGPGHGLESGRRIAGYRIVRELGRGGMGIVYEAVHVGLDRPVALKVLGSHAAPDSSGRRRFLNEARTSAGLHHTHIVPVFDVGQVGGLCYYAMQRIEGAGLDRVLRHLRRDRTSGSGSSLGLSGTPSSYGSHSGSRPAISPSWLVRTLRRPWSTPTPLPLPLPPLPPPSLRDRSHASGSCLSRSGDLVSSQAHGLAGDDAPTPFEPPRGAAYYRWVAELGRQAAEALAHAHHRGIVHRDIKPSNLLVDARGMVWVGDFGLARRLADPSQTQHDSLLGTPRYMSPEQARIGPVDGRSDIYSLGATLYELLTLRPPFEGRTAAELIEQISDREPVPPRRYDPRIPRDLETILLKAMAKRPSDRYATAAELADDLKRFLSHEPVRARRISPVGRFWRFTRRHPGLTVVSATAAAAVLVVATVAYIQIMGQRDKAYKASADKEQALLVMRKALIEKEDANRANQATMRELLLGQASLVRRSEEPNRRVQGLGLLKKAAALGPDPVLAAKLRDEAIGFLMLRDIEARPGLATGPTRGLIFAAEGTRLATIQDNGDEMGLWDVGGRRLLARSPLRASGPTNPDTLFAGGSRRFPGQYYLVEVDQGLVTILPNRRGLRLFDASTGEFVRDLRTPDRHIVALFAAPGGDRLVTVEQLSPSAGATRGNGNPSSPEPGRSRGPGPGPGPEGGPPRFGYVVNLWDPRRWAPESLGEPIATLARWEAPHGIPLVAIAPDGEVVATAMGRSATVSFWSGDDGKPFGEIETAGELNALALGPDLRLATAAASGTIQLWDLESDTALGQITPQHSNIRLLRFHPRGTLLAAVGAGAADIELWDSDSQTKVAVLRPVETDRADPHGIDDLAFAPDGRTLVASTRGAMTPAWAIVDPVAQAQLSGFDAWPVSLALRDDGLLAIGSGRGAIWFWQTGHCASALEQVRSGVRAGETPGAAAAAASPPATTANPATPVSAPGPGPGPGSGPGPAPAGSGLGGRPTSLVFDAQDRLLVLDPDVLQCWSEPPGDAAAFRIPLAPAASGFGGGGFSRMLQPPPMARTQDGRTLFLARHAQILVWRASEPDQLRPLILPRLPEPPSFDRDGRGRPGFSDVGRDDRRPDPTAPGGGGDRRGHRDRFPAISWQALAVAGDGTRLYLIDNGDRVHVLAVEVAAGATAADEEADGTETRGRWIEWSLPIRATALALSPDGQTLAIGDRQRLGSVVLVDTARGIETGRLAPASTETEGQVSTLAFAPGGRTLVVGTQQGLIDLWSLDHRDAPRIHLPGHRGSVKSLAFDPQGRHLASGGTDRTVMVWDLGIIHEELGRLGLAW
jgi:serine/threonine protein kinase/WD40 repeat protein